ncbi:MAG: hypothetical protein WBG50_20300, partial [Desulfomonilaceae bacterium]
MAYRLSIQVVRRRWVESREVAGLASAEDEAQEIREWIDWEFKILRGSAEFVTVTGERNAHRRIATKDHSPSPSGVAAQADFLLISRSGNVVYSNLPIDLSAVTTEQLQKSSRQWSRETAKKGLTRAHVILRESVGLLLAVPRISVAGKYLGCLVTYAPASDSPFGESIRSFEVSQGKEMLLTDLDGDTLASLGRESVSPEKEAIVSLIERGSRTGSTLVDDDVYSFARVPSVPWYVFVRQPTSMLNSETDHAREAILIIGTVSAVLMLLFSLWVIKVFTTPVRELVKATRT